LILIFRFARVGKQKAGVQMQEARLCRKSARTCDLREQIQPVEKESEMNTHRFIFLLIVIVVFVVTACAPSAGSNPADRFAGEWSGTMSFTDNPNRNEEIVVSIPSGCTPGNICGDLANSKAGCKWEMTLIALDGDVFEYKFSKTLGGGNACEAGEGYGGTLTRQSDGTLMREHHTENFTASGVLTKE
jgi:hypothetical protein